MFVIRSRVWIDGQPYFPLAADAMIRDVIISLPRFQLEGERLLHPDRRPLPQSNEIRIRVKRAAGRPEA